jgi:hypothetical protein
VKAKLKPAMTPRVLSWPAPARRWITALALLAFCLQSLALQTHVHQPLQPTLAKIQTGSAPSAPLKLDPMDQCRLCQELVHAGTFITPSAAVSAASLNFVATSFVIPLVLASDPATAFAWQSRAPPRR